MKRGFKVGDWVRGIKPYPAEGMVGQVVESQWSSTFHGSSQVVYVCVIGSILPNAQGEERLCYSLNTPIWRGSAEWWEATVDPRAGTADQEAVTT